MIWNQEQGKGIAQRLRWYMDAKFGLFIHWGAYTVAGVESSWPIMAPELSEVMFKNRTRISEEEYTALPLKFNPVDFNPADWVRTARNAGMRYIIITAKHHDGFCMFDAPGTDYKITNTPFGRDVCRELAQACTDAGIRFGFYYSPPDMHHPGYRDTSKPATRNWLGEPGRPAWAEYLDYMESHIRKLLTDYGHVSVLWFDGLVNHPKYNPPRFHTLIHELSPDTLINDRLGKVYDFITPEQFIPKKGIPVHTGAAPSGNDPAGDGFLKLFLFLFKIPCIRSILRKILQGYANGTLSLISIPQEPYPSPDRFQPWETCMTIGQGWAYNPNETEWKTPGKLVRNLVDVVSGGGNYLLNVGPNDRGNFPPEAQQRLTYIGNWMGRNQESIYDNTYTPFRKLPWGNATRKGDRLYLHVFEWPSDGRLKIDQFPGAVKAVFTMSGEGLAFSLKDGSLLITLPPQALDPDVSVLVVDINGAAPEWTDYSPPVFMATPPKKYMRKQVITSTWINALINGAIAFPSFVSRGHVPFMDVAVDVLITVMIISFLVAWILGVSTYKKIIQGEISVPSGNTQSIKNNAALAGLIIAIACTVILGGVIVDGAVFAFSPGGLSGWIYAVIKTLYTGMTGAVAAVLAIATSIRRFNR